MDRIWQWAWDRYGARYSWVIYAVSVSELLSVYLALSFLIVAFERSDRYVEAAAVTVGTVLVMVYQPSATRRRWRPVPSPDYAILGAASGISVVLIAVHSYPEAALRPARVALAGATGVGDTLPRSRPTFAAWSNLTVLAAAFAFALGAQCWRPCSNLLPVKSQCSSS